jgi:hypothetical protein
MVGASLRRQAGGAKLSVAAAARMSACGARGKREVEPER